MGALRYNLALAMANILFGISFSVYVSLLRGVMLPEQLFSLQLLFSSIVSLPFALSNSGFFRLSLNDFGSIFIVALMVIFGWWYMLIEGASYSNPIDASTISTIGPIFTLITAMIVSERRANKRETVGILVAFSGVALLLFDRGRSLVGNGAEGYGNALVLCAVVSIAINTVLITPVLRRHGAVVVMGWYYIIGTLLAMPMLWHTLPTIATIDFSPLDYVEILYILLLGSTLPIYMLYVGAEHLTATHNAIYRYIQPIVAAIVATARGQAIIDRTNIVGAVLIFVGMLVVALATPRTTKPQISTRG